LSQLEESTNPLLPSEDLLEPLLVESLKLFVINEIISSLLKTNIGKERKSLK
jgi:hypothetical protein